MMKLIVKLSISDSKEKKTTMKAVSGLSGVNSLDMDMKDQKLTVVGDFDPVKVVTKLRKLSSRAEIVSFGPVKESDSKIDEGKKEGKAASDPANYYQAFPYPFLPTTHYYLPPAQQNPNTWLTF